MFNQIVYTRCVPCRDLFDNGKIRNQEGYAIRTFSPEIYNDCDINELEKIQKYMKTRNESKTGIKVGLIDSFEYFPLNYSYVIGYEHQISKARRTTYVKHYYVGDIQEYPIHYLNDDLFSYCYKEEKDFIGENEIILASSKGKAYSMHTIHFNTFSGVSLIIKNCLSCIGSLYCSTRKLIQDSIASCLRS